MQLFSIFYQFAETAAPKCARNCSILKDKHKHPSITQPVFHTSSERSFQTRTLPQQFEKTIILPVSSRTQISSFCQVHVLFGRHRRTLRCNCFLISPSSPSIYFCAMCSAHSLALLILNRRCLLPLPKFQ